MKAFACRLSTTCPSRLYHGSHKHFVNGAILQAQPDGYVARESEQGSELEKLFEQRRPESLTSRAKSVFLSADPDLIDASGGAIDAIYEVEPKGIAELSDLAWYTQAQIELESAAPDVQCFSLCVDNYWSGVPFHDEGSQCPEYRTHAATVISLIELNVDLDELYPVEMVMSDFEPREGSADFDGPSI